MAASVAKVDEFVGQSMLFVLGVSVCESWLFDVAGQNIISLPSGILPSNTIFSKVNVNTKNKQILP